MGYLRSKLKPYPKRQSDKDNPFIVIYAFLMWLVSGSVSSEHLLRAREDANIDYD